MYYFGLTSFALACIRSSFLFTAKLYFFVQKCHDFFIHSKAYFQCLTIANNAAINMYKPFCEHKFLLFLGKYPGEKLKVHLTL